MSVKVVRSTKLICVDSTDAAKAENYLHKFFSEKQVHSEWFCLTKKDLSAIDSELAAMGGVRESNY
jgi:hypothetical protein